MLTFFSPPRSGNFFGGNTPKHLFCLDLGRFGLSFEPSVKVLIASKTSGMTHAEPVATAVSPHHRAIPAALKRACSSLLAPQRAGFVAAIGWQPPRLSILHCAFAKRSMEQQRRNRAEQILAVIGFQNGDFVARIRILMLGTSLLPGQAPRGGAIARGDAMSHRRCRENSPLCGIFSGTGTDLGAPTPQS